MCAYSRRGGNSQRLDLSPPPPPPCTPESDQLEPENDCHIPPRSGPHAPESLPSMPAFPSAYTRSIPEQETSTRSPVGRNIDSGAFTVALDKLSSCTTGMANKQRVRLWIGHTTPESVHVFPPNAGYNIAPDSDDSPAEEVRPAVAIPSESPRLFDTSGATGTGTQEHEQTQDNISGQSDGSNETVIHHSPPSAGEAGSGSSAGSSVPSIFDTSTDLPARPSESSVHSVGPQIVFPVHRPWQFGAAASMPDMPIEDLREKFTIGQRSMSLSP